MVSSWKNKIPHAFRLPYAVVAIAIGTLMSRFGTTMVLPFITIILVKIKHLPLYLAGIAIGSAYFAQAIGAATGGKFLSRINPFIQIKTAICIYAFLLILLGLIIQFIDNLFLLSGGFIVGLFLLGLCASVIETTGQVVISELTPIPQKQFAFSLRYTFINIGSALGPIFAALIGLLITNISFYVAAAAVFLYFILLQMTVNKPITSPPPTEEKMFAHTFKLIYTDKRLFYFIITTILLFLGFSQIDAMFAYVVYHYTASPHIFAIMYAINGMTIVFFQIPLIHFTKRFDIHYVIFVGTLLLVSGLVGIAISTVHVFGYYISMFIFTLGEIFTLSLIGLYTDQLVTPERRYLYFGISNFSLLGRIIGPPLSAILCHHLGLETGLIIIAAITALGVPFIFMAKNAF